MLIDLGDFTGNHKTIDYLDSFASHRPIKKHFLIFLDDLNIIYLKYIGRHVTNKYKL